MRHELVISADINMGVKRDALEFCNRKAYAESELDFPIVLGGAAGAAIIEDLPPLGNILLLSKAVGGSLYFYTLLTQIVWARHPKALDVVAFDNSIDMLRSICEGNAQYSFGDEEALTAFIDSIKQTIRRRKAGEEDASRRKVFFIHIISEQREALNRDALSWLVTEDLSGLGIQLILCGETDGSSAYLEEFDDLFDSVIETMSGYGGGFPTYGVITRQRLAEVYSLEMPRTYKRR